MANNIKQIVVSETTYELYPKNFMALGNIDPAYAITSNQDLNDFKTVGTYYCTSSTVGTTLSNNPYTSGAFTLVVCASNGGDGQYLMQYILTRSGNAAVYHRSIGTASSSWSSWNLISRNTSVSGTTLIV